MRCVTQDQGLRIHPQRDVLYEELHSRPSPLVETPCTISHLALQIDPEDLGAEHAHLAELCRRFDVEPPVRGASCFYQNLGDFELRWERHTEFSSWTFLRQAEADPLREPAALTHIPSDWLAATPGRVTAAMHLAFSSGEGTPDPVELERYFKKQSLRAGVVRQGTAYLYSSFRLQSDGFGRIVLRANDLTPLQAGRLVQRVLEVETYRVMALLALPVAREIAPHLTVTERELARISEELADEDSEADEHALLDELANLAARVEKHRSETTYRFAASNAYYDLVKERIRELGEEKIPGLQPVHVFIERRLAPGIRTCNAVHGRLEDLSSRIGYGSTLLRTRVEIAIQDQNRELLKTMNRRLELQHRLQQAVEGFSVVAITYYTMGLLGYLHGGLKWVGLVAPEKTVTLAVALPFVLLLAWWLIRGIKRRAAVE
jgi:uncharacterized membrane-anchored protein